MIGFDYVALSKFFLGFLCTWISLGAASPEALSGCIRITNGSNSLLPCGREEHRCSFAGRLIAP